MDKLLRQYDICKRLIDYNETLIKHIDLFNNSEEEWSKAENRLRELLLIQKRIVELMEMDPEYKELLEQEEKRSLN